MSLRRIGLVAWHVFKESVRDRMLYAIGAFALLLVAAAILIAQITAGQDVKIIKDLGLAVIELAGVLMAIVIGVGLVARRQSFTNAEHTVSRCSPSRCRATSSSSASIWASCSP